MRGTEPPLCRLHVGRSAAVVLAEAAADERARRIFAEYGVSEVDNPLESLRQLAGEVTTWQAVCRAMIGGLDQVRYKAGSAGEQLRAEVALYERGLDRSARILESLVRLGIEDRLVRLEERQRGLMTEALGWLLGAFGVADSPVARAAVAEMLEAVAVGRVPPVAGPVLRLVPTEVVGR